MYRIEIVSNQSVQEDITTALEEYVPDILYTVIPVVYGRGGDDRKLGTTTWPEKNFDLISYIKDSDYKTICTVIKAVKKKFPGEGIKLFAIKSEDLSE